jgi:DUF4097 and DUF4098 domain-containing protein YvlB
MIKLFSTILSIGLLASCTNHAIAQPESSEEIIHKEYVVNDNAKLAIYNLNGDINVESHSGNKILVDITQVIKGKKKEDIERGKSEVELGFDASENEVIMYTLKPFNTKPKNINTWGDDWNENKRYELVLNYNLKIPKNTNVLLSTVNGKIFLSNVDGVIIAGSVNGNVTTENILKAKSITTVNGDLNVSFTDQVSMDGQFTTVNGDIELNVPKNLSAECTFKSLSGEFYSDFEVSSVPTVEKSEEGSGGKKTYKLNKNETFKIGNGDKKLSFSTVNGDLVVKSND